MITQRNTLKHIFSIFVIVFEFLCAYFISAAPVKFHSELSRKVFLIISGILLGVNNLFAYVPTNYMSVRRLLDMHATHYFAYDVRSGPSYDYNKSASILRSAHARPNNIIRSLQCMGSTHIQHDK